MHRGFVSDISSLSSSWSDFMCEGGCRILNNSAAVDGLMPVIFAVIVATMAGPCNHLPFDAEFRLRILIVPVRSKALLVKDKSMSSSKLHTGSAICFKGIWNKKAVLNRVVSTTFKGRPRILRPHARLTLLSYP